MRSAVRSAVVSDVVWAQLEPLQIRRATLRLLSGVGAADATVRHRRDRLVPRGRRFSRGMRPGGAALFAIPTSRRFAFRVSPGAEPETLREVPAAQFASRHRENHRSRVSRTIFMQMKKKTFSIFRQKLRDEEDKLFETKRKMIQRRRNPQPPVPSFIYRIIPQALLLNRKSIIVTTAFSIVIGIFAYYYKTHQTFHVDVIRWGLLHQPAQYFYRFLMK